MKQPISSTCRGLDEAHEEVQQAPLEPPGEHARALPERLGLAGDLLEYLRLGRRAGAGVVLDVGANDRVHGKFRPPAGDHCSGCP